MEKDRVLPKVKFKNLIERLFGTFQMLGVDSISKAKFVTSGRAENHFCVAKTCQVSLENSFIVDYKSNGEL